MQTQKQQQQTVISVVEKILAHREAERPIPPQLADHLVEVTATSPGRDHANAVRLKAENLLYEDRICEALITFESAISQYPDDLALQNAVTGFFGRSATRLERIASEERSHAEFGRAYVRLVDLGWVSLKLHVIAIQYYTLSDELPIACDLALKMHRCVPAFFGLREAIEALGLLTDDARIQSLILGGKQS